MAGGYGGIDWGDPVDSQRFEPPPAAPVIQPSFPSMPLGPGAQTEANQQQAREAWQASHGGVIAPMPSLPAQPPAPPAPSGSWWNPADPQGSFNRLVGGRAPTSQSLKDLEADLKAAGISLEPANAAGAYHKIRLPNGEVVRVGNYFDTPPDELARLGVSPSWAWVGQGAGGPSGYEAQFNNPSTQLLERYLTQQMSALDAQRAQQEQANARLRAQMPDIEASTKRLIDYLNQRATQLQGAPYTGTEAEILRTQALEPIERDRTAANQRALQQISARGLTPESGISQELMNQVNSVFDRARAGAQGDIAYRTVQEQRDRQREAQQLLGLVPQVQRASATGDLSFLQALDAAVNQPAQQAVGLATANQRLPSMAMEDALRVMGMGGSSPDSVFQQAMGLYGLQNQQNQQGLGWWKMLGSAFPYLLGAGAW